MLVDLKILISPEGLLPLVDVDLVLINAHARMRNISLQFLFVPKPCFLPTKKKKERKKSRLGISHEEYNCFIRS
jgi:hypothetical protein